MCLFSAATCKSQWRLRSLCANARLTERNLHCGVHVAAENKNTLHTTVWDSSLTLDCNSVFAIKA